MKGGAAGSEHRTGEDDMEKEQDKEKAENKASQLYNLSKWQVVEYGIFAFNTTGDMSRTTGETVTGQNAERKTQHHHHHHHHRKNKKHRSTHGDSLTEMPDEFSNDKNKKVEQRIVKKVQNSTTRKINNGTTGLTMPTSTPTSLPRGGITNEKLITSQVGRSRSRSTY